MYFWDANYSGEFIDKVLELCVNLDIGIVAGPVMSGAVMASSIATAAFYSGRPLLAVFLNKVGMGRYEPGRHRAGVKMMYTRTNGSGRTLIVDDTVDSGMSMVYAAREVVQKFAQSTVVAALSGGIWPVSAACKMKDEFPKVHMFSRYTDDIRDAVILEEYKIQVPCKG